MNNRGYIIKLIKSIIITILLLYLFIMSSNAKLALIPFIICSFAILLKDIFMLMGKYNYINILNKVYIGSFLLFWFGFLFYWCYESFMSKEYTLLLFSIPFWICGIVVIKKKLL